MYKKKTHCINGHPLSGDNLYIQPDGKRKCKACRHQRSVKSRNKYKHLREERAYLKEVRARAVNPSPKQIYFDARVVRAHDGSLRIL